MTNPKLTLPDLQFPGDELEVERHSMNEIGLTCYEHRGGLVEEVAGVALTLEQARELAAWIMANSDPEEAAA